MRKAIFHYCSLAVTLATFSIIIIPIVANKFKPSFSDLLLIAIREVIARILNQQDFHRGVFKIPIKSILVLLKTNFRITQLCICHSFRIDTCCKKKNVIHWLNSDCNRTNYANLPSILSMKASTLSSIPTSRNLKTISNSFSIIETIII